LSPLLAEQIDVLEALVERAEGRRLVSVTVTVGIEDPGAAIFGARMAGDRWFCWEVPEDGFALAGLGSAAEVVSRGEGRFRDLARDCAALARGRVADEPPSMPAGAGPVWMGGFAFAADGGRAAHWASFPPALMTLPEVALWRRDDECLMTLSALAGPGADRAIAKLRARVGALSEVSLPPLDPRAGDGARITSPSPPGDYEAAVAGAVAEIRETSREKLVLAREVRVEAPRAHDTASIYAALRSAFPTCFCFCCGSAEGAFLGASPELLVRRNGASAATVALAGSTRRSADPAVDDHLGEGLMRSAKDRAEHEIVVRRIARALRPHSVWVEAGSDPVLVKVANIQHLASPVHAQLADPRSAVELAGLLHPTPAVGGEPPEGALDAITRLERLDRGWYAGPIGWMDAAEDGEFCVGLRSALLRDRIAHLFAGAGIVAESDPAAELAETELKLDALLPLLAG
jgi:salicylate biosynthesis isochorismate synthase/menaquinone-specific isochorismate synthase